MSFLLTQNCIDMVVEMSSSCHAVLVVLCRFADEEGNCFPSLREIAERTHLEIKTVRAAIRTLAESDFLSFEQDAANKRRYTVNVGLISKLAQAGGENGTTEIGTTAEIGTTKNGTTKFGTTTEIGTTKNAPDSYQKREEATTKIGTRIEQLREQEDKNSFSLENSESQKNESEVFVDLYNEILGNCVGKCMKLTDKRVKAIKSLIADIRTETQDVQMALRCYFEMVRASDFLTGRSGAWKANFDWLLNKNNRVKVLEGNYANTERKTQPSNAKPANNIFMVKKKQADEDEFMLSAIRGKLG